MNHEALIKQLTLEEKCALLSGRDYVLPDDIRRMALPVLSHRLILTPEARMKGVTPESIMNAVMNSVTVPVRL